MLLVFVERTFLSSSPYLQLMLQIERFTFTGGLGFVIDYGLLIGLTEIAGLNYLWSATISFCVAVIVVYILSVKWVYGAKSLTLNKRQKMTQFVIFIVLSAIGLLINNFIIYCGVELMESHYALTKIFASGAVMVFNFITRKILIEGRRQKPEMLPAHGNLN